MSATIIGDVFIDIIYPLTDFNPGETHFKNINIREGGNAFVAIQISRLGGNAKFIGKLGDDVFGHYFTDILRKNNVRDLTTKSYYLRTGLCISMTYENGERTMIADRKANDDLSTEDIMQFIDEIIESKIIYFSGYSMVNKNQRRRILNAISEIKRLNESCIFIFNPGAPNIIASISNLRDIILEQVDIFILNLDEAKILTGKNNQEHILRDLNNLSKINIISKGNLGCVLSNDGIVIELDTKKIDTKDTTGAGDAFSAGFITGYLRNMSLIDSAKFGNEVASNFLKAKS